MRSLDYYEIGLISGGGDTPPPQPQPQRSPEDKAITDANEAGKEALGMMDIACDIIGKLPRYGDYFGFICDTATDAGNKAAVIIENENNNTKKEIEATITPGT